MRNFLPQRKWNRKYLWQTRSKSKRLYKSLCGIQYQQQDANNGRHKQDMQRRMLAEYF
jgi:hypothetical protein